MHQHPVGERHPAEAKLGHGVERSLGGLPERGLELVRSRPAGDRCVVELDDRHHLTDGRGGERLLRTGELAERVRALLDGVSRRARELEHRRARDAGEDAEVERGRVEGAAATPPDVRRRPFEHGPVGIDEDGVVGSAAPGLGLGGHVDGVARRLHSREEPRLVGADAAQGDQPLAALAQRVVMVRQRADERERRRVAVTVARRPDQSEDDVWLARRLDRLCGQLPQLHHVHRRQIDPLRRPRKPFQMLGEAEAHAGVDADRLERAAAAQERLVVGAQHRLGRIDDAAATDCDREEAHRVTASIGAPIAASSGVCLRPRLLDLGLRVGVPDDPAADPEVDPSLGDREGADRQRQLEVAVAAHDAQSAHRGAAADGLELGDQVDGGDLGRSRDRASREGRREQLGQADVLAQRSFDGRHEVRDAGELALDHQLRPPHRARLADAREIVPLQVDDHHVLGRVLLPLDVLAERTRALDRAGPHAAPAAAPGRAPARRRRSPSRRRPASAARTRARRAASEAGSPPKSALRCWTRLT